MSDKTILTCAVTGNITSRAQNPALPVTPAEITQAVVDAANAGAAVAHVHVRDPATEQGSMDIALYREVVEGVAASGCDIVMNLTTGEGGRFVPDPDDPKRAAPGTTLCPAEKRVAHIHALRPEVCTHDFNTMVSGERIVMNPPASLEKMARAIADAGTLPEIELFDSGDLVMAKSFLERGLLPRPPLFQIVLGVRYGAPANPATLAYLVSQLPTPCHWAAFGIGRRAFPVLALAFLMGGHVRIGMEDTVHIARGELATGNGQLVEKAVRIVEELGGAMATPAEARAILDLPRRSRDTRLNIGETATRPGQIAQ